MNDREAVIDRIARSDATKSDRIRALDELGLARADIARALGIRYQFVRNVLVDDERRRASFREEPAPYDTSAAPSRHPGPADGAGRKPGTGAPGEAVEERDMRAPDTCAMPDTPSMQQLLPARTVLAPGGQLTIPESFLAALGIEDEDEVFLQVEGDEIRVYGRDVAIRQVQELVAKYVPPDVSLVDALIAERRREGRSEDEHV